jgi:hypothetical protein
MASRTRGVLADAGRRPPGLSIFFHFLPKASISFRAGFKSFQFPSKNFKTFPRIWTYQWVTGEGSGKHLPARPAKHNAESIFASSARKRGSRAAARTRSICARLSASPLCRLGRPRSRDMTSFSGLFPSMAASSLAALTRPDCLIRKKHSIEFRFPNANSRQKPNLIGPSGRYGNREGLGEMGRRRRGFAGGTAGGPGMADRTPGIDPGPPLKTSAVRAENGGNRP